VVIVLSDTSTVSNVNVRSQDESRELWQIDPQSFLDELGIYSNERKESIVKQVLNRYFTCRNYSA